MIYDAIVLRWCHCNAAEILSLNMIFHHKIVTILSVTVNKADETLFDITRVYDLQAHVIQGHTDEML